MERQIASWKGTEAALLFPSGYQANAGTIGLAEGVRDSFTAADLYIASHLEWGMNFGTIERRPAFEAYSQRHVNRPAAKRADEIDNALMPQQQPEPAE